MKLKFQVQWPPDDLGPDIRVISHGHVLIVAALVGFVGMLLRLVGAQCGVGWLEQAGWWLCAPAFAAALTMIVLAFVVQAVYTVSDSIRTFRDFWRR